MNIQAQNFLTELLAAPSPSGFEQPAAKLWREYVKPHVDELSGDVHGNSIAVLNPDADFKFMLAGHIDEIGLMITHIDDKGYIYTAQIGGMEPALLIGQRVRIITKKGEVFGVIGRKAIHMMTPEERKKNVEMDNIWIDIGSSPWASIVAAYDCRRAIEFGFDGFFISKKQGDSPVRTRYSIL